MFWVVKEKMPISTDRYQGAWGLRAEENQVLLAERGWPSFPGGQSQGRTCVSKHPGGKGILTKIPDGGLAGSETCPVALLG